MNYLVIQLSRHEALIARFARQRSRLVLIEAARHPLAGAHALPALREGLSAAGEERVVLVLPSSQVYFRELELPIRERRRLREVVPLELAGETALEGGDLVFDALPLADGRALAVWGREREVAETIRLLSEQQLEPEVVTVSPCHWRELLPPASVEEETVAVTDGESLAVFREGELLFCRSLGGEEPVAEVERTLRLLEIGRGIRVDRVFSHGPAARREGADGKGGEIPWVPLPIVGQVAAAFPGDEADARDIVGAYAAAAAVHRGEAVDLRSGPLAYTAGKLRLRRRLRLTAALALLVVLLLVGETAVRYYLVQRDLASVNASIAAIYREVFPTRKKAVDEVAELRSEIRRLGGGGEGRSFLTALNRIAEVKGEEVAGIYEAELDGDQLRLKGDARSIQAVNDFKSRAARYFASGEVGEMKTRPDGSISFAFRATVTEGAK